MWKLLAIVTIATGLDVQHKPNIYTHVDRWDTKEACEEVRGSVETLEQLKELAEILSQSQHGTVMIETRCTDKE